MWGKSFFPNTFGSKITQVVLSRPRAFFLFFFFSLSSFSVPSEMKRSPNASSYQMRRRKTRRWPAAGGGCRTTTATSSQTSSGRNTRTSWRTTAPSSQSAAVGGETLNWGRTSVGLSRKTPLPPLALVRNFCDSWQLTQCCLSRNTFVFFYLIIMCFDFPHV